MPSPRSLRLVPSLLAFGLLTSNLKAASTAYIALCCNVPSHVSVLNLTTFKAEAPLTSGLTSDSVALSPNGTRAYIVNERKASVSVIDTATGSTLATIPLLIPEFSYPGQAIVSPDGARVYLVAFTSPEMVFVIDTATNKVAATFPLSTRPDRMALSPNGKSLYFDTVYTMSVLVYDTTTMKQVSQVNIGQYPTGVAATPDGKSILAPDANDELNVIDVTTHAITRFPLPGRSAGYQPQGVISSPDSKRAYLGFPQPPILGIELANGQVVLQANQPARSYALAVTPDGSHLISANGNATVTEIDTATSQVVNTITQAGPLPSVAVSPDGGTAYVVNSSDSGVAVVDVDSSSQIAEVSTGAKTSGIAVTPDNSRTLAGNAQSSTLSVVDNSTNRIVGEPFGLGAFSMAFANGNLYAIDLRSMKVANPATFQILATVPYYGLQYPDQVVAAPDGKHVYVSVGLISGAPVDSTCSIDQFPPGYISVVDTSTNKKVTSGSLKAVGSMALSPDGSHLYVTGNCGNLRVVDTATLKVTATIKLSPTNGFLNSIAISPDASRAYVVDYQNSVVDVVDLISNQQTGSFVAGTAPRDVAFAPGGQIAYVTHGNQIAIVDVPSNSVTGSIPLTANAGAIAFTH